MYSSKFTGIGRYVYELVHHLAALDTKNTYVLFFNEPEFSAFIPPNERFTKILAAARHYSLAEQTVFLWKLMRAKLDLMHFTHFNAPILYPRKSIVTIHDLTLSFFPGNKMRSPFYRAAYRLTLSRSVHHAKKIITVSNYTAKDLEKMFDISPEKIHTIYEGVNENFIRNENVEELQTSKKKFKIEKPYILYTGVWRSHKNLVNLIRAFKQLKDKYKEEVQLIITGRKDPLYPEVERTAKESGYENDIIFTGMISENDLINLYSGAHAYCLPSLYEGFGLSPLEAMKCGIPTVVSRVSCLPEVCGDAALYFDPCDSADICEKLHTATVNDEIRTRLITEGHARVQQFSWKKMTEETLEIYNRVS
jgi:glycosyltransferase involved in cell wall biosynthesis